LTYQSSPSFGTTIANYLYSGGILSDGKEIISVILFYAQQNNRVVETLEKRLVGQPIERFRTVGSLAKRLRKPCHGLQIALMVIRDRDEMIRIGDIQNLIRDLRLVLVLPGRDDEMVSMAHRLGPRFIAYADNGFEQAIAVVHKMAGWTLNTTCPGG
jgi:hypothetical protein